MAVIRKLREKMDGFVFILVGDGETEKEIKKFCNLHNMNQYVRFLGKCSDIERIYQGLDLCIMPSIFEGFPVAAVEALATGLPLLLSDRITPELSFSSNAKYLPLKENAWADEIMKMPKNRHRETGFQEVKSNGYDITETSRILEWIYTESQT